MKYFHIKTIVDILFAFAILCLVSPVLVLLSVFMGIYSADRLGQGGCSFAIYKLKTMRNGNEADMERLTGLGSFCRRYSIDELPQLINVIKGEMSFVGPRPLPIKYDKLIKGEYRKRFDVKPGITGLTQVSGRNLLSWRQKFDYDIKYVLKFSFLQDFTILLLTIPAIFSAKGVNAETELTMEEFKGFE